MPKIYGLTDKFNSLQNQVGWKVYFLSMGVCIWWVYVQYKYMCVSMALCIFILCECVRSRVYKYINMWMHLICVCHLNTVQIRINITSILF